MVRAAEVIHLKIRKFNKECNEMGYFTKCLSSTIFYVPNAFQQCCLIITSPKMKEVFRNILVIP